MDCERNPYKPDEPANPPESGASGSPESFMPVVRETFISRIIGWSANNQFLVVVAMLFVIAGGIVALNKTSLDAIPDLSDVQVIVFTKWPGQDPQLMEDQVTYPIVSVLAAAPHVKYVRGQSFFGLSFVNVVFEDGTDMYWARSRVLEYLKEVSNQLPPGIQPVLGPDATGVGWVYEYALVDTNGQNSLADLRTLQDWYLRYYLQDTPGVAEVASVGGFVREYEADVDPNKLLAYHIPLSKVVDAIRHNNNDVGGRVVEFNQAEYMVKGIGYIETLDDLKNIVVGTDTNGTPVTIAQVAHVHFAPDMRRGALDWDGKGQAVGGIVVMRYGENALKTIQAVKAKLKAYQSSLPPGVKIVSGYDRSQLIERAVSTLRDKVIEECLIVSLICVLFLFHFRSAFVAILVLPIAILLLFIAMVSLGLSSNIMSLGGIAIAVGAMTPGAVVLIENAHKWLERWNHARAKSAQEGNEALTPAERETARLSRFDLMVLAAKQVGRPLFFSLLIITVSFLPVFALTGESGRLFKPLAYTKTFSMLFASLLTVTLVPILMVWFIRGRIAPEHRHPISRFFSWLYRPFANLALRFKWLTLLLALVVLAATWYPLNRIGSEFMPPLNEGTLLFMPSSVPGISITEAKKILQKQDATIMTFPEVDHVYGKVGRADTPTDPAPLAMTETIITLKPQDQWRPGMTIEKIKEGLQKLVKTPGAPSVWWMPIQTRIEMLSTGIRSQIGITIYGPDLGTIQKIGTQIETVLKQNPHSVSVYAERIQGGYYLDFKINRKAIARYGLSVGAVENVLQSAIGGMTVSTVIAGRERYPIDVRYGPALRQNLPALRRVLVGTPDGAQVPLQQLANIYITNGPAFIRDENGMLNAFVFVDTKGIDLGSYVAQAKKLIADHVKLPPGYYLGWGGQFQYMQEARQTLKLVIPMTLLIIFVLLYLNFGNPMQVFLVLLTLPFSMVGGIWFLWALHYNFSVAVAVGFIALAGVATEIGVVMIVYLDEGWESLKARGDKPTYGALLNAVREGAVQRVRPVMMTFFAITAGLLPIMWSQGTGALAMKRIAAPMIGGMVSTLILTLLIVPVVYFLWRSRSAEAPPPEARPAHRLLTGTIVAALLVIGAGGWWMWHSLSGPSKPTTVLTTQTVGPYQFKVLGPSSGLKKGRNPIRIEITDATTGKPADVGSVWFDLQMQMPGMAMQAAAQLEKGQMPGVFNGFIEPGGQGEWHASLGYQNRETKNSVAFTLNISP